MISAVEEGLDAGDLVGAHGRYQGVEGQSTRHCLSGELSGCGLHTLGDCHGGLRRTVGYEQSKLVDADTADDVTGSAEESK